MENANLWPTRAEDPESTSPAEPESPAGRPVLSRD